MAKRKKTARGSRLKARGRSQARPRASSLHPPALRRLWAPWRATYLATRARGCFLCQAASLDSARDAVLSKVERTARGSVVAKTRLALALPNRYPYNTGHLLIAPTRHVGRLEALRAEEWAEMLRLLQDLLPKLRAALRPQGFNLGLNLGVVAGAGVPGHLHLHVVPRWRGDTNFMPVVGETKVLSRSLESLIRLLRRP